MLWLVVGLLHVGDIVKEINGQEVSDPDQLQEIMKKSSGSVTFKVLPGIMDAHTSSQVREQPHIIPGMAPNSLCMYFLGVMDAHTSSQVGLIIS